MSPESPDANRLDLPGVRVGRVVLLVVAGALLLGLVLELTGHPSGGALVGGGLVALVAMPAASLAGILISTIRRREWRFTLMTLAVVVLLTLTLFWSGR